MSARVTMMERLPAQHEDLIHDVQLDYYGKRLASAGSDRLVKIFDVQPDGSRQCTAHLTYHEGPVWCVAWAHPRFGTLLASCSYDRQVVVWKENSPTQWSIVHKFLGHEGSVNAVVWSPHEHGLRLACASSDENVSVLTYHGEGYWSTAIFKAHKTGCNTLSWAPHDSAGGMQLVTGGCDNLVKLWRYDEGTEGWVETCVLPPLHSDWVRGVAWAPSAVYGEAGASETIASCSQDKKIAVWTESGGAWTSKVIELSCTAWSVSWSVTGRVLAAAGGDNQVTLWKESATGEWLQIGQLSEDTAPQSAPNM